MATVLDSLPLTPRALFNLPESNCSNALGIVLMSSRGNTHRPKNALFSIRRKQETKPTGVFANTMKNSKFRNARLQSDDDLGPVSKVYIYT